MALQRLPLQRPAVASRRAGRGRRALAAVAVAPVLGAALLGSTAGAQSGATGSTGATGASGATGPAAVLQKQLLVLSQLGSGWERIVTTGGGIGCLDNVLEPPRVRQTATVNAAFRHSGGTPQLFEQLATYTREPAAYTAAAAGLSRCHKVSGDPGGDPTTGTVRRIHFETFGKKDKSVAYEARLDVAGLQVEEVFVIVSTGKELMALTEASIGGTMSIPSLDPVAKAAVARL
jgi:hypothetical protein